MDPSAESSSRRAAVAVLACTKGLRECVSVVVADAALVLGIIGAVTGCFGALIGGLAFMRDRPDLEVTTASLWPGDDLTELAIQVVNEGRQPVAVTGIGLALRSPPSRLLYELRNLTRSDRQYAKGRFVEGEPGFDVPVVLEPGHVQRGTVSMRVVLGDERERVALWACVWDSRGRISRSSRILVASGNPYRVISAPKDWGPSITS